MSTKNNEIKEDKKPLGAGGSSDQIVTLLDTKTKPIYPYTTFEAIGEFSGDTFTAGVLKSAAKSEKSEFIGSASSSAGSLNSKTDTVIIGISADGNGDNPKKLNVKTATLQDLANCIVKEKLIKEGSDTPTTTEVTVSDIKNIFKTSGSDIVTTSTSGQGNVVSSVNLSTNAEGKLVLSVTKTKIEGGGGSGGDCSCDENAIKNSILSEIKSDPTFRGPRGPKGDDGDCTGDCSVSVGTTTYNGDSNGNALSAVTLSKARDGSLYITATKTTISGGDGPSGVSSISATSPIKASASTGAVSLSFNFDDTDFKSNIKTIIGGTNIDWSKITNKPNTFKPSSHNHEISQINGLADKLKGITGDITTIQTSIKGLGGQWDRSGSTLSPKSDSGSIVVKTAGKMQAANGFFETSDSRLKTIKSNIDTTAAIDFIKSANVINFNWKSDTSEEPKNNIGLIAQDVEQYYPEFVSTNEDGYKSVDYAKLCTVLIPVLKDLITRVEKLEK